MTAPEPQELLALARPVAEEAGRGLVVALGHERTSIVAKSSVTDFVTEMDRSTEAMVLDAILAGRPHDAVVGEEGADRAGTTGVRWHIDPIDGTVNFVHAMPGFCVSIAAEHEGIMLAGVVVSPLHGDTFTATRGGGAFRNGEPVRCSTKAELPTALVGTGFSYSADRRRAQARVLARLLPEVADIRRTGSAALDLCWVGCGRLDGYYEDGLNTWDYAAGALVAAEAGARVGGLEGGPGGPPFMIAAPEPLFEPLRALLVSAGAVPFG